MGPSALPSNPKLHSSSTRRSRDDTHSCLSEEQRSRSLSRPRRQLERSQNTPLPEPADSASSITSSLLNRTKFGSGYVSSCTDLEDDNKNPQSTLRSDSTTKSLRQRRLPGENRNPLKGFEKHHGTGDAVWARVATVASTLTVGVSKAWASNITTFAGEETPPGQESRLTRAMKAYHLEKARDPTDLPSWLFDERERRRPVSLEQTSSRDTDNGRHERDSSVNEMPKPRGLRDIYDAYRPEAPVSRPSQRVSSDHPPPSKATDRLKALRDAKRNALGSAPKRSLVDETGSDGPYDSNPKRVASQRQLGLPSGPRRL